MGLFSRIASIFTSEPEPPVIATEETEEFTSWVVEQLVFDVDIAKEENFQGVDLPNLLAREYRNCNFSFKEPLERDGKKVGHPLNINALFVECNLVNREPHPESILINCNTAIVDTEISEYIEIDHGDDIANSNLPEAFKSELLKTAKIETQRNIIRPHKIYGKFDHKNREYVCRGES